MWLTVALLQPWQKLFKVKILELCLNIPSVLTIYKDTPFLFFHKIHWLNHSWVWDKCISSIHNETELWKNWYENEITSFFRRIGFMSSHFNALFNTESKFQEESAKVGRNVYKLIFDKTNYEQLSSLNWHQSILSFNCSIHHIYYWCSGRSQIALCIYQFDDIFANIYHWFSLLKKLSLTWYQASYRLWSSYW